jgi:uncharacterized membrane protein YgaE (UPF0421/DUF939 family)
MIIKRIIGFVVLGIIYAVAFWIIPSFNPNAFWVIVGLFHGLIVFGAGVALLLHWLFS